MDVGLFSTVPIANKTSDKTQEGEAQAQRCGRDIEVWPRYRDVVVVMAEDGVHFFLRRWTHQDLTSLSSSLLVAGDAIRAHTPAAIGDASCQGNFSLWSPRLEVGREISGLINWTALSIDLRLIFC